MKQWPLIIDLGHYQIDLRYMIPALLIVGAISFALNRWTRFSVLGFWPLFLITLAGILINGWLADWEDEQPGGFNNPIEKNGSERLQSTEDQMKELRK